MNSFVRISVSHCLVFQPAHSGFASFTLSLSFCTVVNIYLRVDSFLEKACCSPKKICVCLFPVFTLLGNPLHMDLRNAYLYSLPSSLYCIAEPHKRVSMTTFGSRLSTCYRVLQKERLLTCGVDSPGQSRGISPLQGGDFRRSKSAPQRHYQL